jgi:outer membrane protein TolC
MSFIRSLLPLLSAAMLTACAVGPDYHRPNARLPERYLSQPADQSQTPGTPAGLSAWWEGFDDPMLTRLVSKGLEQNLDLAQAIARVTQARAGVGAATAALLPSGAVAGSAARARQSIETPQGQLLNATPDYHRWGDLYEVDLQASWEIDVFGGQRRGREAAVADFQASQSGVLATRLAVAAQIADTYIITRGLQARIEIARRQVRTQEDLVDKLRLMFGHGVAAEYQLRQAEGDLRKSKHPCPRFGRISTRH